MKIFIYLFVALVFSCKSKKTAAEDLPKNQPVLLIQDNYSGAQDPENIIVKSKKRLQRFFAQVNKTRKPGIPVPEIDFTKEMVVIACAGESKERIMPHILLLAENKDSIILKVKNERVQKAVSGSVSSPFCLYKIPRTQKGISFE